MLDLNAIANQILESTEQWSSKLIDQEIVVITDRRNNQHRNIRQIVGHMVDSASNNTHRIIHFQYQESPISYPDYANLGNNDRWIAIQNYEDENWENLVNLWKHTHIHIAHVIKQVDQKHSHKEWVSALKDKVSLSAMIEDFPKHMQLHLGQIDELLTQS